MTPHLLPGIMPFMARDDTIQHLKATVVRTITDKVVAVTSPKSTGIDKDTHERQQERSAA